MEILIFIRVIAFFSSATMFYPVGTPNTFKVILSFTISVIISNVVNIENIVEVNNMISLLIIATGETILGFILGYITNICFSIIRISGGLIDQQMGLSMINIMDPNNQSQNTLIENLVHWISLMIFVLVDGHHMIIKSIVKTYEVVPIGASMVNYDFLNIVNFFVETFTIGFKIAIPILMCLLLSEFIMGLLSRSVPQLNIMVIGVPIKIIVGLILFTISMPLIIDKIIYLIDNIPKMYESTIGIAPMFFMLNTDKTEEATSKKKSEQRKKGNIAKSKEISNALTLITMTMLIPVFSNYISKQLKEIMNYFLSSNLYMEMSYGNIENVIIIAILKFMMIFLPVGFAILLVGVLANLAQVGFLFTKEPLKPSLSKINPLSGFKNMFSMKQVFTLFKDIIILCILGYMGYSFFQENYVEILKSNNLYTQSIFQTVINYIYLILKKLCAPIVCIAIIDYTYQKFNHKKGMRMSKQEVKDEYKQVEGDPQIKSKIKQKQKEIASRRMMQEVPNAAVIINNPTHISIAIKYERGRKEVPIVIAKGADNIALKIREIAKEHDIPMIENKPLARLIYKKVEINEEIPEEMYQAVAEILVAVYKINNRYKKIQR